MGQTFEKTQRNCREHADGNFINEYVFDVGSVIVEAVLSSDGRRLVCGGSVVCSGSVVDKKRIQIWERNEDGKLTVA